MHPKTVVILGTALAVIHGLATEWYLRRGLTMSTAVTTLFALTSSVLAYLWYHQDAKLRGFTRKPALSAAVILLPFVGLPVYAAASRGSTGRMAAAFKVIGFIALLLVISVVSGITLQVATAA